MSFILILSRSKHCKLHYYISLNSNRFLTISYIKIRRSFPIINKLFIADVSKLRLSTSYTCIFREVNNQNHNINCASQRL